VIKARNEIIDMANPDTRKLISKQSPISNMGRVCYSMVY